MTDTPRVARLKRKMCRVLQGDASPGRNMFRLMATFGMVKPGRWKRGMIVERTGLGETWLTRNQ